MKEFTPDHIRNVCLIGHGGAGKTMTAEAMLLSAGVTTRLGRVEEGNTVSDYRIDEIDRQISVSSSLLKVALQVVLSDSFDGGTLKLPETRMTSETFSTVNPGALSDMPKLPPEELFAS